MSAFLIVLLILYVLPSHITHAGVSPDYLTKEATAPVKGLFLLLVFATHFVQYVKLGGVRNGLALCRGASRLMPASSRCESPS